MDLIHWLLLLQLLLVLCAVAEYISLTRDCRENNAVVSFNYPTYYNSSAVLWEINCDKRIVVTLNDFKTRYNDLLAIEDEQNICNKRGYSGFGEFTPYLSQGNVIQMFFEPGQRGFAQGFNISTSPLEQNSPQIFNESILENGFIELQLNAVESWCSSGWDFNAAETICREAGYPGAYDLKITPTATDRSSKKEVQCSETNYRLRDCSSQSVNCTGAESVTVICQNPSFSGCYDIIHRQDGGLKSGIFANNFTREECILHCRSSYSAPQIAMQSAQDKGCLCVNQQDLSNYIRYPEDHKPNHCRNDVPKASPSQYWVALFNTSVGYCDKPPELENGKWDTANETHHYIGSRISASCEDDYGLHGGETLTCGPARSSKYDIEWIGSLPVCQKTDEFQSTNSYTTESVTSDTSDITTSHPTSSDKRLTTALAVVLTLVVVALFLVLVIWTVYKCRVKHCSQSEKRPLVDCKDALPSRDNCSLIQRLRGFCCCTRTASAEDGEQVETEMPLNSKPQSIGMPRV